MPCGCKSFFSIKGPSLIMCEHQQRTKIKEMLQFVAEVQYRGFELRKNRPVGVTDRLDPLQDLFACLQESRDAMGVASVAS